MQTADDCTDVDDIQTGQSMTFTYRNRVSLHMLCTHSWVLARLIWASDTCYQDYNHAEGISLGELSNAASLELRLLMPTVCDIRFCS